MIKNKYLHKGFTLVELMITVIIVAIITTIAVVTFIRYVSAARRSDGMNAILSISLAEERYRASNTSYGTLAQVWNNVSASPQGYYSLAISNISSTSYTITATTQGAQVGDSESGVSCNSLVYAVSNGTSTTTPTACWPH